MTHKSGDVLILHREVRKGIGHDFKDLLFRMRRRLPRSDYDECRFMGKIGYARH